MNPSYRAVLEWMDKIKRGVTKEYYIKEYNGDLVRMDNISGYMINTNKSLPRNVLEVRRCT